MDRSPDWLEIDGARTDESDGFWLEAAGIRHVEDGREIRAAWQEVLGVAVVDRTVYVLVPRRPPAPPWIAVGATDRDPATLASEIRTRSERAGYREARIERSLLDARTLASRVMERLDVAGGVEIPARITPSRPRHEALFAMAGAGVGCLAAVTIAVTLRVEAIASIGGVVGAVGGMLGGVQVARAMHRPERPRVMVLAPDGIVASLNGQVRAMRWDEVAKVEERRDAVRVIGTDGKKRRLDTKWIDAPIPLVVAIAEAYRARWSAACARA